MGFKGRERQYQRQNRVFKMRETVWITKRCCLNQTTMIQLFFQQFSGIRFSGCCLLQFNHIISRRKFTHRNRIAF